MSTALPGHVVEMMKHDDNLINDVDMISFQKRPLLFPAIVFPCAGHVRTERSAGGSRPGSSKTWDEFANAAKALTKDRVYRCIPCGSNDLMGTRFLNFYVRSRQQEPPYR